MRVMRNMRANGRRKVMFATNYPMITAARALEGLDAAASPAEEVAGTRAPLTTRAARRIPWNDADLTSDQP